MNIDDMYKIHRPIIYSIVLVFEFLGIFGNVNLIILTYRKTSLQSKYVAFLSSMKSSFETKYEMLCLSGLLLALLALFHTICLIFEFVDIGFGITTTFSDYEIHRNTCYYATFIYVIFHCLQTGTMCIISFDLLLTILFPTKYRRFRTIYYFPSLFFLPLCYAIISFIGGFLYINDDVIKMCNPPSSLAPQVNRLWSAIMMVFSVATVVFYASAFSIIYYKMQKRSSDLRMIEKKAMKTLQLLIFTFLLTRFVSASLSNVLQIAGVRNDFLVLIQNYNVIPAVVSYSQNAYVCFFRSAEYRYLLTEQIRIIFPKLANKLSKTENVSSVAWAPYTMAEPMSSSKRTRKF